MIMEMNKLSGNTTLDTVDIEMGMRLKLEAHETMAHATKRRRLEDAKEIQTLIFETNELKRKESSKEQAFQCDMKELCRNAMAFEYERDALKLKQVNLKLDGVISIREKYLACAAVTHHAEALTTIDDYTANTVYDALHFAFPPSSW